jgi:hypothetical protein
MITIGDVASILYARFEPRYRDQQLAAVATQVALGTQLEAHSTPGRRGTRGGRCEAA